MANRQRYVQTRQLAWTYNSTKSGFEVLSLDFNPDVVENSGAENYIGQYTPYHSQVARRYGTANFTTWFRGSSVADVAPPEGVLLQACGMNAANTGTTPTSVWTFTGSPTANPHLSTESPAGDTVPVTLTGNKDRRDADILNCVGNAVFNFIAGQPPTIDFSMMGQVDNSEAASDDSPYTEAAPSTFLSGTSDPVPFQSESITFTPDGGSAEGTLSVAAIRIDLGAQVEMTEDGDAAFGVGQFVITGFQPRYTIEVYDDLDATFNWYDHAIQRKIVDVAFTHNAGAGLREEADIAFGMRVENVEPSERNGKELLIVTGTPEVGGTPTAFSIAWQAS